MLEYYNKQVDSDTNYEIINFILSNFSKIEAMSTQEIADKTFVSKATITRFVRKFGYKDFSSFKKEMYKVYHNDLNSAFRTSNEQLSLIETYPEKFIASYTESICEAIKDSASLFDYSKIDKLIDSLLNKKSGIFAYNQSLIFGKEIQTDFLIKNKVILIGETYEKQKEIAQSLDNESVALIFSNYGNYFKEYSEIIDLLIQNKVQLILVTLNYSAPILVNFDEVITLSSKRFSDVGGYPLKLFTEYLVRRVMVK